MGVCMCGGESERGPPCGCAAYVWMCGIVCVVAGERERERGGGEGGEGVGRNNNNPSSKPLDKHRRRELSKQLPTLVEKTQIFYLVKEFALFSPRCVISEL